MVKPYITFILHYQDGGKVVVLINFQILPLCMIVFTSVFQDNNSIIHAHILQLHTVCLTKSRSLKAKEYISCMQNQNSFRAVKCCHSKTVTK